jgi:hypothetical protein
MLAKESFTQSQEKTWVGLLIAPGGWQIKEWKKNVTAFW